MALSGTQGYTTTGQYGVRPSWEPSAPSQDRMFSDLNPLQGNDTSSSQTPSQHGMNSTGDHSITTPHVPTSTEYPQTQGVNFNQAMQGAPMASGRQTGLQSSAVGQSAALSQRLHHGQDTWETFPASTSSAPELHERQGVQQVQPAMSQPHPGPQPQMAEPELTAEDRKQQYMQQQARQHQDEQHASNPQAEQQYMQQQAQQYQAQQQKMQQQAQHSQAEQQYMQQQAQQYQTQQQYTQQQAQQSRAQQQGSHLQADGIPAEYQLPADQQGSGNPFDAPPSQVSPAHPSETAHASIAGAQSLTGDQHNQRQPKHRHNDSASASALAPQSSHVQQSASGLFPKVDYDWANPTGAEAREQQQHNMRYMPPNGPPDAPGGPSWPPQNFIGPGPGYPPMGPPAYQGFGPPYPYGPQGPMGPPGFNQYGPPPPVFYPPPPGPPPIGEPPPPPPPPPPPLLAQKGFFCRHFGRGCIHAYMHFASAIQAERQHVQP